MQALIAGNTVVFKPSEVTPLVGGMVAKALQTVLPAGVFELIQGDGAVGAMLVDAAVDMVGFTGSCGTGKRIMAACAGTLKRIVLELGGKDPMVVFKDADLDLAAEHAVTYSLYNAGQVCCGVERIYIEESVKSEFEAKCLAEIKAWKVGDGAVLTSKIGPLVSDVQRSKVADHVASAVAEGATLLHGGSGGDGSGSCASLTAAGGYFYPATLLTDVPQKARITKEETFGPVVAIMPFNGTETDAVQLSNDSEFGLTASV